MAEEEYTHPENVNLLDEGRLIDKDERAALLEEGLEFYKIDTESRQEWDELNERAIRLYFQKDSPINPPWQGASSESIPMMAEAVNQFHGRAFQAMFPRRRVLRVIPIGKSDAFARERAKNIETHMTWQLMDASPNYVPDKDMLLMSLPLHGAAFTKTYYDHGRGVNVVKNVRASDLIVPYGIGQRNIEDVPRKTERIYMPMHRAKFLAKSGFFSEEPEPIDLSEDVRPQDRAVDNAQGLRPPGYTHKDYCLILEQHRFADLDGDGYEEPYIVWIDWKSQKLLRVSIRYETDEAGNPVDEKVPIEYYTNYNFINNPNGFYGLGYNFLIGQINTAVNKTLRQLVDAGTLATAGNNAGLISSQLGLKKGDVNLPLGKFTVVNMGLDDIRRAIYQFNFPGPNPVMQAVLELLLARGDRLAMVTEAVTGQLDKVLQPTTVMALLDQSNLGFSAIYKRFLMSWSRELEKIYDLNRRFLSAEEYFTVLDAGDIQDAAVARADYATDMQVKPIADPQATTMKERLARSEAEFATLSADPLIMGIPQYHYAVLRRRLEALEVDDINEVLPDPMMMGQMMMAMAGGQPQEGGEPGAAEPTTGADMAEQQQNTGFE